jgi:hypothetical protein
VRRSASLTPLRSLAMIFPLATDVFMPPPPGSLLCSPGEAGPVLCGPHHGDHPLPECIHCPS